MYVVLTHLDGIGPIDPFQFDDTDETDVLPHGPGSCIISAALATGGATSTIFALGT